MTNNHTPGPWSYHKWGKGSGTRFGIETADHRHGIASVAPNENASTLLSMSEHEANARLIAAAPELLAALQKIFAWVDADCDPSIQSFDIARQAMNKAIGAPH